MLFNNNNIFVWSVLQQASSETVGGWDVRSCPPGSCVRQTCAQVYGQVTRRRHRRRHRRRQQRRHRLQHRWAVDNAWGPGTKSRSNARQVNRVCGNPSVVDRAHPNVSLSPVIFCYCCAPLWLQHTRVQDYNITPREAE